MDALTTVRLADWLATRLGEEPGSTLLRESPVALTRLGLALDPRDLPDRPDVDAVFLHRHFRLGSRLTHLGVVVSHDGFDARLTTGENRALADRLDWRDVTTAHWPGRAVGLVATPPQSSWTTFLEAVGAEYGGFDEARPPLTGRVNRVVLANAMRPELIEHAAALGVDVYLTGQARPGAFGTLGATGMGLIALGHRRSELWGLRQLARELTRAFPGLATVVFGGDVR